MATDPVMPIVPPFTPELLPEVQAKIEAYLRSLPSKATVLELGAGWSTVWLAQMGFLGVTSVENNLDWYLEVRSTLANLGLSVSLLHRYPTPELIREFPNNYFDLVYVDCIDPAREPCALAARDKVKIGGWLVLDDSHWEMLQTTVAAMKGWGSLSIEGTHLRKSGERHFHRTTIFKKERLTCPAKSST